MLKMRKKYGRIVIMVWMLLFTFQERLSKISSAFSYIDEAPLALFVISSVMHALLMGKIKRNFKYSIAFIFFVGSGIVSNIVYHYQPLGLVVIDLIANLKFFCAISYFYGLINDSGSRDKYIPQLATVLSVILAITFCIDRVINIFPGQYRFGIKSAALFYGHPTYLAGICAFLIAILTVYDPQKYKIYILFDLLMLMLTLRSKAIVSAIFFVMLYIFVKKLHCKLKIWQMAVGAVIAVICAWSNIYFYFIKLGGHSARSVMLMTALRIMKDYFPIGTGFACYASHSASASVNYSPVYVKYGFDNVYELRNSTIGTFFDDQFWPIVFGQTGVIGTIGYIILLFLLFVRIQKIYKINLNIYMSSLFIFIYLMISSIAEPAFNNSISIPLAFTLAISFSKSDQRQNHIKIPNDIRKSSPKPLNEIFKESVSEGID